MATRVVSKTINLDAPIEEVSKYITDITDTGIRIHPENNIGNEVLISDGVYIKINNDIVAKYTDSITIGKEGANSICITDDVISMKDLNDSSFFTAGTTRTMPWKYRFLKETYMYDFGREQRPHDIPVVEGEKLSYPLQTEINYTAGPVELSMTVYVFDGKGGWYPIKKTATVERDGAFGFYNFETHYEANWTVTIENSVITVEAESTITDEYICIIQLGLSWYDYIEAPTFSFGWNTVSGNFATAIGLNNISSNEATFCAGSGNTASGPESSAIGTNNIASGFSAYAEGLNNTASGDYSHSEGIGTTASGKYSHSQNEGTIAGYDCQTVIGKYNNNQSTNIFEIGNGTADTTRNRSNALTVDWSGIVNCKDVIASNLIGEIKTYAGAIVPDGWLECDGSEVLIKDYPLLAAALGADHPDPDDSDYAEPLWGPPMTGYDYFVLPDLNGKVLVGQDPNDTDFDLIGETGGSKYIQEHTHSFTQPTVSGGSGTITGGAHTHPVYYSTFEESGSGTSHTQLKTSGSSYNTGSTSHSHSLPAHTHTVTDGAVNGVNDVTTGTSNNIQPYAVVKYIICAA